MPVTSQDAGSATIATRIARVLATEIGQAAEREEFGLLVQDIHPIDPDAITEALSQPKFAKKGRLRIVLVDDELAVLAAIAQHPVLKDLLSHKEETAVAWRNKHLKTIAVIARRPLAKAASLREFRTIGERDLIRRFCDEQREAAPVTWLRLLWDALGGARTPTIRLASIVAFAEGLEALSATERSAQAPRHLHLLGLFPDSHLADETTEGRIVRRLQNNRDLVQTVMRAAPEDWNRIRGFIRSLTSKEKTEANRLLKGLKKVPDGLSLQGLDFAAVQALWKGKSAGSKGGGGAGSGSERVPVERIVATRLMHQDDGRLADISEEICQIVQATLEDDDPPGQLTVHHASTTDTTALVNVDRSLLNLVRSRSTELEWGGTIDVASEQPSALTEVAAFKAWTPFQIAPIRETLQRFVDEKLAPKSLIEELDTLVALRTKLVPVVGELAISPIALLAGNMDLLAACEAYLECYEQVLRQIHACYHDMHSAADPEAEAAISQLLALETYVFRRDDEFDAMMSPLHPLALWRSATLVREIRGLAPTLSPHEAETVARTCTENAQFLQVLLLPPSATGLEQPKLLGHAGFIGRLPLFREAPRGLLETDGIDTIADMARRIAQLRPFVRSGLQVVLVNLPHPKAFVAAILDHLDLENTLADDTFWGVHLRIRYTHPDTRGWAAEFEELEDALRDAISAGEECGLLSISIQPEVIGWHDFEAELKTYPAHLAVVMDPFEVRSTQVARAAHFNLSPWMPACEYRFNRIRKEIQVIPVAEEHVFGSYLAAAGLVHTVLQKQTPTHQPQVQKIKEHLDRIAANSLWTVLADPHRVPIPRLGDAETIDRRVEKNRQITCFASDLAPFVRRLDQQLRRTHFIAQQDTLYDLARDLVAMEPNGILGLATSHHDRQVKGSLGKIIAVRWYRMQQPSGLAVSLDTENARRWLVAGHHSYGKADLLGLRDEGETLIIDVLEVKAYDEAAPYTVREGVIEGHAVGQLLATIQALAEVFTPGEASPLARPRREVLREHLYTALLRDKDPAYIERWHALLADVFDGKLPVKLSGRVVHVQLASVAGKETVTYLTKQGIPITVETLSAEDVGFALRPDRPGRLPPPGPPSPPGVAIDDRVEPAAAFKSLSATRVTDDPSEHLPDQQRDQVPAPSAATSRPIPAKPVDSGSMIVTPMQPVEAAATADAPASDERLMLVVPIGTEHAAGNAVTWKPGQQSNGFFLILGASGSGKTETLKVLGTPIAETGIPVLVFDFHGDVILPGVPSVLLSSGSASTLGLNPMELDISSAEESGLYDQRAALRNMIQRAVPALGHRQSSILRDAFDEAYQRAGIRDDDPGTWTNPPPTFRDIQEILGGWAEDDQRRSQRSTIEGCIAAVQELFDHPIFQRAKPISVEAMLTGSVRLDLSKLPDQIRFVATETLLRKIFRTLRLRGPIPVQPADDRQRFRLFVVIDEAKILALGGGERDRADNILNELITEARKFGLVLAIINQ